MLFWFLFYFHFLWFCLNLFLSCFMLDIWIHFSFVFFFYGSYSFPNRQHQRRILTEHFIFVSSSKKRNRKKSLFSRWQWIVVLCTDNLISRNKTAIFFSPSFFYPLFCWWSCFCAPILYHHYCFFSCWLLLHLSLSFSYFLIMTITKNDDDFWLLLDGYEHVFFDFFAAWFGKNEEVGENFLRQGVGTYDWYPKKLCLKWLKFHFRAWFLGLVGVLTGYS